MPVSRDEVFAVKLNLAPAGVQFPGAACRAARRLLGISQAELKDLSGVSKKTINDAENGMVAPSTRTLAALRAALEAAGAEFVVGDGVLGVRVVTRDVDGSSAGAPTGPRSAAHAAGGRGRRGP